MVMDMTGMLHLFLVFKITDFRPSWYTPKFHTTSYFLETDLCPHQHLGSCRLLLHHLADGAEAVLQLEDGRHVRHVHHGQGHTLLLPPLEFWHIAVGAATVELAIALGATSPGGEGGGARGGRKVLEK